ncbi:MAG: S1 family peptidase [Myxococcota bacterium]
MKRLFAILVLSACAGEMGSTASPLLNGAPVVHASRPYLAFLQIERLDGEVLECSGTVVGPHHVLTAAHCVLCATSVQVSPMSLGLGLPPGAPPLSSIPAGPSAISLHPDPAAIELNYCSLLVQGNAYGPLLYYPSGSDLAVIDLGTAVNLPHATPLLTPPHGFAPVQDTPQVVLAGRGQDENGSTALMREGSAPLLRWFNQTKDRECSAWDDPNRPWTLQTPLDTGTAAIQRGDSGGPMFAVVGGSEYVVGVHSAMKGDFGLAAATFTRDNAGFLSAALGSPVAFSDLDGDQVVDPVDNCPLDVNPDQIDRDDDGVGDVCDVCAPDPWPLTELGPAGLGGTFDPAQRNTNQEAEDTALLTAAPWWEHSGRVPHVSMNDYLEYVAETPCPDTLIAARHTYRRGDACDPIPAAESTPVLGAPAPGEIVEPLGGLCGANGYGLEYCSYRRPVGFDITGEGPFSHGEIGHRFCACDAPHGTPAGRRLWCSGETSFDCAIAGDRYAIGDPAWRRLHVAGAIPPADGLTSVMLDGSAPSTTSWDFVADAIALSATPIAPPFSVHKHGGAIAGSSGLNGILWTRVVSVDDAPITSKPADGPRHPTDLANVYRAQDLRYRVDVSVDRFPIERPPWPWEFCAVCGLLELPFINPWILEDQIHIVGVDRHGAIELRVEERARNWLASPAVQLIPAAEGYAELLPDSPRQLVLEEGVVIGTLGVMEGAVVATPREAIRLPDAMHDGALAWSTRWNTLFALSRGRGGTVLWEIPLDGRAATIHSLDRSFGPVLALTHRLAEGAVYAVVREEGRTASLVRVDAATGATTVILRDVAAERASIAGDARGGLLLAVDAGAGTDFLRLAGRHEEWEIVATGHTEHSLGTTPVRETPRGALVFASSAQPVVLEEVVPGIELRQERALQEIDPENSVSRRGRSTERSEARFRRPE